MFLRVQGQDSDTLFLYLYIYIYIFAQYGTFKNNNKTSNNEYKN